MNKILIVDDDAQNLYMLEILLKTHGFEVELAANGSEALELAQRKPPDIIISDILMPVMDGFSLCRAWKADKRLNNIPFIFYTATYTDLKDEEFALNLGADRFMIKPMDPDELLTNLQDLIRLRTSRGQITSQEPIGKEGEYYKEYSETLIRKLEHKMIQLQRANKRLASSYQASCDLVTFKSPTELIHSVLSAIVENEDYLQASYYQFDKNQNKLSLLDVIGCSDEIRAISDDKLVFALGQEKGLVGLVAQSRQLVNVTDTSIEPRWIEFDPSIKSALFVPVQFEKLLLGVAVLFSAEKNAFSEEDEHNITALANSLAIAIENKKTQEHVQKQLQRLSALHSIDNAINSGMDLDATLDILLTHVTAQLKIDAAVVLLYNEITQSFEFSAGLGFDKHVLENNNLPSGMSFARKAIIEHRTIIKIEPIDVPIPSVFATMWFSEHFSVYAGVPLIAKGEVKGVLEVFNRSKFSPEPEWINYLEILAGQAAIAIDIVQLVDNLQHSNIELITAYDATIEGWSRAMDLRDHETEGHTQRVLEMTTRLAIETNVPNDQLIHVRRGALLHDIGKIGIPDHILLKSGQLTDEEWAIMHNHPQLAYDMLSPIDYLRPALDIPYYHHEKWDGTGYPCGLRGEHIPLVARLFAVVDVWDALSFDRPYRQAWSQEKVFDYIRTMSGTHFDPTVVDLFFRIINQRKDSHKE